MDFVFSNTCCLFPVSSDQIRGASENGPSGKELRSAQLTQVRLFRPIPTACKQTQVNSIFFFFFGNLGVPLVCNFLNSFENNNFQVRFLFAYFYQSDCT